MHKHRRWSGTVETLESRALLSTMVVQRDITPKVDAARGVAVERDGTIVVAGIAGTSGDLSQALKLRSTFGLVFYFGNNKPSHLVTTDFGPGTVSSGATSVVIQRVLNQNKVFEDKVVAAGFVASEKTTSFGVTIPVVSFALARYNADGSPDTTFGTNGTVIAAVPTAHLNVSVSGQSFPVDANIGLALGVAIQPDNNRIVLAGTALTGLNGTQVDLDVALARFYMGGGIDPTFGSHGFAITYVTDQSDAAAGVVIQPVKTGGVTVNDIVIAGASGVGYTFDPLNPSSSDVNKFLDPSASPFAGSSDSQFLLARYNPNGTLDTSFGASHNGKVTTNFGPLGDGADAIALTPDNRIVAAGVQTLSTSASAFAVAKYTTDGAPVWHNKFLFNGYHDSAQGVAVGKDGSIFVAGAAGVSPTDTEAALLTIPSTSPIQRSRRPLAAGLGGVLLLPNQKIVGVGFKRIGSDNTAFATLLF